MSHCLFCNIIARKIPSDAVYEDPDVYAFLDIHPVNPGHVLVAPKKHSESLHDADEETVKLLIRAVQRIARGITSALDTTGFNVVQNNGAIAGQVISHLHFHVIPRRPDDGFQHWKGVPYADGEGGRVAEKIRAAIGTRI